jgi:hypothetical protein
MPAKKAPPDDAGVRAKLNAAEAELLAKVCPSSPFRGTRHLPSHNTEYALS